MTSYPNSSPSTLSGSHRRTLFGESGIAPPVTAERGTYTARRGKDVPQDHGRLPTKPGLVFPVHTLDGGIFCRLRLNNPGRLPKYMQPKGHPNRLDVHPSQHERIRQPGGMRLITEGEKKVDAGVSRGLLMVGLSGVWNGQKDGELIPDWLLLPLRDEQYSICYDSDIETNEHVQMAADRQAQLLREAGAEVFITLLPPAADGSKQGLDDFLANGGTVAELELLTRPYDPETVERARLTRDEKLRSAVEDLERRFWATEWKGMGGASARDVALKLIEAARRHGKVVADGIRVTKAQGPLALEAKVSGRTLWKSLNRLEEWEFCYRDNEDRKQDKAGAFVLRANVSQYGEKQGREGSGRQPGEKGAPGDLHLRAPRLRWSQPKYMPRRGLVSGTRKARRSPKREPRDRIERLGKIRGAILDVLDASGGCATVQQIADALHRARPRDLRRRNLPMLEEAGIIGVDGELVTLSDNWLEALEAQRQLCAEIAAADLAKERYKLRSSAYHARHKVQGSKPSAASLEAVKHSREHRAEYLKAHLAPAPRTAPLSPLAVAVRDYLERRPVDARQPAGWIGSTLWAYELHPGKPTPADVKDAIKELGGAAYLDGLLKRAGRRAA